jgi:hypothetical protein
MHHGDVATRSTHRRGECRRRIPVNEERVGLLLINNRIEPLQNDASLRSGCVGTDLEVIAGRPHFELLKENVAQHGIIMLAGVDEQFLKRWR